MTARLSPIYREHSPHALAYARGLCRRREDAEDLVAEAFARTFTQIVAGAGPTVSFVAYLRTALRNAAASQRHREVPVEELPETGHHPDHASELDRLDDIRQLRVALHKLDPASRQIIVMRDVFGLSPAEVNRRLGLRPNTAAMRYARARVRLRELCLADENPSHSDGGHAQQRIDVRPA